MIKHAIIYVFVNAILWLVWFFAFRGGENATFFSMVALISSVWLIILLGHIVYKTLWKNI